MENQNIEKKFKKDSKYQDMVRIAGAFAIETGGVKRGDLAELLNTKREETGHEDFDKRVENLFKDDTKAAAASTPANPPAAPTATEASEGNPNPGATPTPTPTPVVTAAATTTPRASAKKWYEETGFPFNGGKIENMTQAEAAKSGDLIEINDRNPHLKGRQARVSGPSNKKDAIKAYAINPKSGELQNTNVTLNMDEVSLAADQVNPRLKNQVAATVATPAVTTTTEEAPAANTATEQPAPEAPENPAAEVPTDETPTTETQEPAADVTQDEKPEVIPAPVAEESTEQQPATEEESQVV